MARYNAMYILSPALDEEARKGMMEEIASIFTSAGVKDIKTNVWGMRTLAYEIEDFKEGFYVDLEFECSSAEALVEYDRICNIKEAVIRHIVVKLPKGAK